MSAPLVIGFDTSTAACRVALLRGDSVLAEADEEMARGQAERLMELCRELLQGAGAGPGDLAAIGVGTGPGNFTGIRISVAAARGLALGLGVPAVGVTGFEALCHGQEGPCAAAIAAPRDQVYLQCFDADGRGAEPLLVPCGTLPPFDGPLIGAGGAAPAFPPAVAICHLARARMHEPQPRPAPLYLRPADAAPARDAPPRILP